VSDPDAKQRVINYYNQEAASYIDQYQLPRLEQELYPANGIRLEMLVRILKAFRVRNVLDNGCGSAGPLLRFLREGWDAIGFDFSPEMVNAARENLTAAGADPGRVRVGDVEQVDTLPPGSFDAVVAAGVFPHNLEDRAAYASVRHALSSDGIALVEYRNALMGLFSLNRYSEPFFWHELMNGDALPEELQEATREFLVRKFDTPAESVGRPRTIEYADILTRFHNPLTIGDELASHGLRL
jgi:SAM-dependent methyltransferase